MTQEDKELLLKDLCARLPYKVRIQHKRHDIDATKYYLSSMPRDTDRRVILDFDEKDGCGNISGIEFMDLENDKPYLRPMSSMTEEERDSLEYYINEYGDLEKWGSGEGGCSTFDIQKEVMPYIDWLNKHHFDYRGLIEKGLALEAPEGMYKTE